MPEAASTGQRRRQPRFPADLKARGTRVRCRGLTSGEQRKPAALQKCTEIDQRMSDRISISPISSSLLGRIWPLRALSEKRTSRPPIDPQVEAVGSSCLPWWWGRSGHLIRIPASRIREALLGIRIRSSTNMGSSMQVTRATSAIMNHKSSSKEI